MSVAHDVAETHSPLHLLSVAIVTEEDPDRLLSRLSVTAGDLKYLRDETWLAGMRAGLLPEELSSLAMTIHAGEISEGQILNGFELELSSSSCSFRKPFTVNALESLIRSEVAQLIRGEALSVNDNYRYFLTPTTRGFAPDAVRVESDGPLITPTINRTAGSPTLPLHVKSRGERLTLARMPLQAFMLRSEPLFRQGKPPESEDEGAESWLPVFVSARVWEEGRQLARRGGEKESAAVWTGRLCRDSHSSELFLVLDACLEAEHAAEEKFSVTFSDETWGSVRERLQMRRRRLHRPEEIIVGTTHGHNFQPEADASGRRSCDACHLLDHCTRTTAVASSDDHLWHRCVFAGQPWAVLLVWGWNAREEEDWRLYGLQDGALRPRGIRLVPNDFPLLNS